jgi:hypothetical protein
LLSRLLNLVGNLKRTRIIIQNNTKVLKTLKVAGYLVLTYSMSLEVMGKVKDSSRMMLQFSRKFKLRSIE